MLPSRFMPCPFDSVVQKTRKRVYEESICGRQCHASAEEIGYIVFLNS